MAPEQPNIDYRDSHKCAGKGAQYEEYYRTDKWNAFLWEREQEILEEILRRWCPKDTTALDFACGTGRVSEFLVTRVDEFIGVDVSDEMLVEARRKTPDAEFVLGDIIEDSQLLAERTFDLITAFRFFVNAQPLLRSVAIRRLAGMLGEDGVLVFNIHHHSGSPYVRLVRWSERRHQKTYNTMSLTDVRDLLSEAGLFVLEAYGTGLVHIPKVKLPVSVNLPLDRFLGKIPGSHRVAEDLIVVAGRL